MSIIEQVGIYVCLGASAVVSATIVVLWVATLIGKTLPDDLERR